MEIPDLPNVPIDLDDKAKRFLQSLDDRISWINAARVEGSLLTVLGQKQTSLSARFVKITQDRYSGKVVETSGRYHAQDILSGLVHLFSFGLYYLTPCSRRERQYAKDYKSKVEQYRAENLWDIQKKVKDIRVYQGTIDELQIELGKSLKRVETRNPETFLKAKDTFWLRVHAYLLGADAVVHYQPGSSIGTPVKYINQK